MDSTGLRLVQLCNISATCVTTHDPRPRLDWHHSYNGVLLSAFVDPKPCIKDFKYYPAVMASTPQAPGSPHRGRPRDTASGDRYSINDGAPVSQRESSIESALNGLRTLFELTEKKANDLKREMRLRKHLLQASPSRSARGKIKGLKEGTI